jgi:hypothetical protein
VPHQAADARCNEKIVGGRDAAIERTRMYSQRIFSLHLASVASDQNLSCFGLTKCHSSLTPSIATPSIRAAF